MPADHASTSPVVYEGEALCTVLSGWSIVLNCCRRSAAQTTILSSFPNLIPIGSSAALGTVGRRAKPTPLILPLMATLGFLWMAWPTIGPLDDHDFAQRPHVQALLYLIGAPVACPHNCDQMALHHHPTAASLLLTDLPARNLTTTEQPRSTAPTTTSGEGHPHIYVDGENIRRVS